MLVMSLLLIFVACKLYSNVHESPYLSIPAWNRQFVEHGKIP